ncbi:glucosamine-6-phosphate deaminase [Balneicella halophila]|uniref:Glucosamine-6-phosphate deaminase n=1 Tax=Balneicella halophila TaxID=1537566 RepID=A0A7L4UR70_BALHA|nr:glucosamine-6-phosphate deaminase [Balneicella halophila]PVX51727.1 glucosamine-6-phosphate deaminase [Balneicella halophila]
MKSIFETNSSLKKHRRTFRKAKDDFEHSQLTREEHIPLDIYEYEEEGCKVVAEEIADLIREKQQKGEMCVLGLATGNSPRGVYKELVRLHKEDNLSFSNVITFNLDEYYPMEKTSVNSYNHYMNELLFDHVDIKPENIYVPDGSVARDKIKEYCNAYEKKIDEVGGIDLQLLGIGRTGHIGFNEPGSYMNSYTRIIALDDITIDDAVKDFGSLSEVPKGAITMGVGSIFKAQKIILLAWGSNKAEIIKKAVEGKITDDVPASFLQQHKNVKFVVDIYAAGELTRVKYPWKVASCDWTPNLILRAITDLCMKTNKPILKLTDKDYSDHGLGELLVVYKSAYDVNIRVFNILQHTITGWPGGKPNADDTNRPERKEPEQKRVIVFSPHPDDDVISMGGTLKRLVDQKHDVHVAYQVSGNIAVADYEVLRYLSFFKRFFEEEYNGEGAVHENYNRIKAFLKKDKDEREMALPEILKAKTLIRQEEAKSACRYVGVPKNKLHFLNLPFYETGQVKKNPLTQVDIDIIKELLREVKPHQIYAAGDLMDPHGTHKVCLEALFLALDQIKKDGDDWLDDCWVWLYRGAWQEWAVDEIEMAVPLSPDELRQKRNAILRHQSQMEAAPFMGGDSRLFWQRAEDRNRDTAMQYNKLGLAEYEAIEAFVRYIP